MEQICFGIIIIPIAPDQVIFPSCVVIKVRFAVKKPIRHINPCDFLQTLLGCKTLRQEFFALTQLQKGFLRLFFIRCKGDHRRGMIFSAELLGVYGRIAAEHAESSRCYVIGHDFRAAVGAAVCPEMFLILAFCHIFFTGKIHGFRLAAVTGADGIAAVFGFCASLFQFLFGI